MIGGAGNDTIDGRGGEASIDAGDGDDRIFFHGREVAVDGGAGTDTLVLRARANVNLGNSTSISNVEHADASALGAGAGVMLVGTVGANTLTGGAGDDTLIGAGGNDTLAGNSGADVARFSGQALEYDIATTDQGNTWIVRDLVANRDGVDSLSGVERVGFGNATYRLQTGSIGTQTEGAFLIGATTASGTNFADVLLGGAGNDNLSGQDGDDILIGAAGNDILAGGRGNDQLFGGAGANTLDGGAGDDLLDARRPNLLTNGGFESGLVGWQAAGYVEIGDRNAGAFGGIAATFGEHDSRGGGSLSQTIQTTGNITVAFDFRAIGSATQRLTVEVTQNGTTQTQTVQSIGGDNWLSASLNFTATAGTATIRIVDSSVATAGGHMVLDNVRVLEGGVATSSLSGGLGSDSLFFGESNDSIDLTVGGEGINLIDGGGGNDSFQLTLGGAYGSGTIDGGSGTADVLNLSNRSESIEVNLAGRSTQGLLTNFTVRNVEIVTTGSGNDTVRGSSASESITAGAGNDLIETGGGRDTIVGGDGNDTVAIFAGADAVSVDLGAGTDTVRYVAAASSLTADLSTQSFRIGTRNDTISNAEGVEGTDFNDVLTGNSGANVLAGGAGNDSLYGGAGNDTLAAGAGNDWLDGGAGFDVVDFSTATEAMTVDLAAANISGGSRALIVDVEGVYGGAAGDRLTGNASANELRGMGGADRLWGGAGNDTLDGGEGNDTLAGDAGADTLLGGAGNDQIDGGVGDDSINGGAGNDTLSYAAGYDVLDGGDGTDTAVIGDKIGDYGLSLGANNTLIVQRTDKLGSVTLSNIEAISFTDVGTVSLVNVSGASASGSDVAEIFLGGAGTQSVAGGAGNDIFLGIETVDGGAGNDLVIYGDYAGAATVTLSGNTYTVSSSKGSVSFTGVEAVQFADGEAAGVQTVATSKSDFIVLTAEGSIAGSSGNDRLWGSSANDELYGEADADVLVGQNGDDTLDGGTGDDSLFGGDGNDALRGGGGNDILDGGAGIDALNGGSGADRIVGRLQGEEIDGGGVPGAAGDLDTVDYSLHGSGVTVDLVAGTATGSGTADTLSSIENVIGTNSADRITGDAFANWIMGGKGSDTLDGGAGTDDTVSFDDATSVDIDLVVGEATHDGFTDVVSNFEHVVGSRGHDRIIGSLADNVITGGAGNDTIDGDGGDDTAIFSGNWGDYDITLQSGTYVIRDRRGLDGEDRVTNVETFRFAGKNVASNQLVNAAPTVSSTWVAKLPNITAANTVWEGIAVGSTSNTTVEKLGQDAHIATLTITDPNVSTVDSSTHTVELTDANGNPAFNPNFVLGTGSNFDKLYLVADNTLDADVAGGSTVTVHLKVTDASGASTRTSIVINVRDFAGSLSGATVNAGTSEEDTITGTESADRLTGRAGDDTITGAAGNDTIYGDTALASTESGADSIDGGDGNDLIVGGRGNDVLVGGAGNDTLSYQDETRDVTITYSAPTTAAPTMSAVIAGGEVDTVSGFEAFVGGAGNDTFRHVKTTLASLSLPAVSYDGGAGRDTLDLSRLFDNAAQEQIAGGMATIRLAFGSQQKVIETLGQNARAEHLVLNNIENVIGTKFNDSISGTTADNRIDGGAGNDTIRGEGGADTLIGGAGNDEFYISSRDAVIIELDGEGVDTVYADATYFKIGANIENLVLRDTGMGIGNAAANLITGSAGGDTLEGGAGADTIDGGSGNDFATYRSSLNGVVVRLRDDTLAVAQVGGDAQGDILINIEHLEGSAFADILTGNSRENILIGGAGNDVLDGGAGFDWADYRSSGSGVEIDLRRDAQVGGDAQGDVFLSIEAVRGSAFNDVLTGNASDNVFDGAAGADVIDGQAGIDTVTYASSARAVSVSLRGDRTGTGGDAEGDRWIGIENIVGSSFDDTIEAGNAQGVVYSLDGGSGRDVLSFANADGGAVVNLGISKAQSTGTGNGSVILSRIEGVQGSRFADTLTGSGSNEEFWGGDGNDSLSGGQGVDRLTGGAGNDILTGDRLAGVTDRFFQDTFVFVTGGGNDTINDFAVGTGSRDFDVLDFSAFGFSASDLVLSSGATVGVSVAEFNANNYKIALIERATATSDYQIMYRDGESTATLTLKYNQAITWDAKFFDFTP